jgi:hypothetical protein
VEGLVGEKSGQGRFRYPATSVLRLALTELKAMDEAALGEAEVGVRRVAHSSPILA